MSLPPVILRRYDKSRHSKMHVRHCRYHDRNDGMRAEAVLTLITLCAFAKRGVATAAGAGARAASKASSDGDGDSSLVLETVLIILGCIFGFEVLRRLIANRNRGNAEA